MQQSLNYLIRQAYLDYEKEDCSIQQWVLSHVSQAVLVVDQINFTRFTEEYIQSDGEVSLKDWWETRVMML
jgi:hypothetical protein